MSFLNSFPSIRTDERTHQKQKSNCTILLNIFLPMQLILSPFCLSDQGTVVWPRKFGAAVRVFLLRRLGGGAEFVGGGCGGLPGRHAEAPQTGAPPSGKPEGVPQEGNIEIVTFFNNYYSNIHLISYK